jgi:nucleoside-diphosphate-sugar epimerase
MGPQTIWVTGSRGFIGSRLVSVLREAGLNVRGCTNQVLSAQPAQSGEASFVAMNYLDAADIRAQVMRFGVPDIFIHSGWGGMATPESAVHLDENVRAGKTLIQTLFEQGVKTFVFVGSMNEYGAREGRLTENMAPEGRLTNYAKAKIEVARFGFEAAKALDKTFIHVRTFYVFGAGQRSGSLINQLYQSYRAGTKVELSPCEHYRDYIHVSEVAEGLRLLCRVPDSTTVNLGSGSAVQVKDFVRLFWKSLGGDEQQLHFGARAVRPDEPAQPRSYADLTHLKALTHWTPSLSLEEGIQRTISDLNRDL